MRRKRWASEDLLASASALARPWRSRRSEEGFARASRRTAPSGRDRSEYTYHRQIQRPRWFSGAKTGPDPTDQPMNRTKRHLTDGRGTPLAIAHSRGGLHDSE